MSPSLTRLLRISQHRRLTSSRLFSSTGRNPKSTPPLTPGSIGSAIDSLYRERNLNSFVSRFKDYSASSQLFRSKLRVHEVAVRRLAEARRFDDVVAIVENLQNHAAGGDEQISAASIITLYGKAGMLDRAREAYQKLPRSTHSFNAFLSVLEPDGVIDGFQKIQLEYPEIVPDVLSYSIIIRALCEKGEIDAAMGCLGSMEEKGVVSNVVIFNTLLDALYKNDRYDDAEKIWGIMSEKDCRPNVRSFNGKLRWLASNRKTDEAVKVFGEMESSAGMKPDGYSITALIVGYCNDGNLKEAKKLFGQMRRRRCPRNLEVYEALVPKVTEAGELNLVLGLCYESMKTKCYVSVDVLQAVVDGLVKSSRVDDAKNLVKTAWSSNYSKDILKMPSHSITAPLEVQQNMQDDKVLEHTDDQIITTGEETNYEAEVKKGEVPEDFSGDAEEQAKRAYCKIGIIVKSFEKPKYLGAFGIPPDKNRVKLPSTRTLITVLRSPHIDKKSREQFEMKVRREYMVIKCEPHELHKKYFWFKRTRIIGAQFELVFNYKTRLDMSRLLTSQ